MYQDLQTLDAANVEANTPKVQTETANNSIPSAAIEPPKATTHIRQHGNRNTANPGTVAAPIKQGDCGVVQNGGSNNIASPNCSPPIRSLTDAQKRAITEFLKTIPSSVQVSIGSVYGSHDGDLYANDFFPLFDGRHLENATLIRTRFPATFTNVFVATPTNDDPASIYRSALVEELNALGIAARPADGSKVPSGDLELIIGFSPEEVNSH
jgi:hypothetical protein